MLINTNEILKDLREGLAAEYLTAAVGQHGAKLLNEEISYVVGGNAPKEYAYLVKVAGDGLSANNDSDATKFNFAEIECAYTRKRLERLVDTFGARAFFHAAVQVHEEKVDNIISLNLQAVLRQTSLKEMYSWFTNVKVDEHSSLALAIDPDKVTNAETRDLIAKLSELYGGQTVALRIEGLIDGEITARLKLFVEGQAVPTDRIKAFTQARAALAGGAENQIEPRR